MLRNLINALSIAGVAMVGCNNGDRVDLRTEVESLRAENATLRADIKQLKQGLSARDAQHTKQDPRHTRPASHTEPLFEQGILRFPDSIEKAMMGDAFRHMSRPPVMRFESLKIDENAQQDWLPATPGTNEE